MYVVYVPPNLTCNAVLCCPQTNLRSESVSNPFPGNTFIDGQNISTHLLANCERRLNTNSIFPSDHHKSLLLALGLCDLCVIVSVLWECYLHNDLQMCRYQQQPLCQVSLALCCMQEITPMLM